MKRLAIFITSILFYSTCLPQTSDLMVSEKLSKIGYFNLMTESSKIESFKKLIDKEFEETNWLTFNNNYYLSSLLSLPKPEFGSPDYRSVEIYGADMFEGNLMSYLEDIKRLFDRRGLRFELGEESMVWGKRTESNHHFKHTVPINGMDYLIYEGNINDYSINHPQKYVERTMQVLNEILENQNSQERFILLTHLECIYYILGDEKVEQGIQEISKGSANEVFKIN